MDASLTKYSDHIIVLKYPKCMRKRKGSYCFTRQKKHTRPEILESVLIELDPNPDMVSAIRHTILSTPGGYNDGIMKQNVLRRGISDIREGAIEWVVIGDNMQTGVRFYHWDIMFEYDMHTIYVTIYVSPGEFNKEEPIWTEVIKSIKLKG